MTTPAEALERLRRAEASGELADLAERLGLGLIVAFGSAARGESTARDLDIAVGSRSGSRSTSASSPVRFRARSAATAAT
jgi:predicted nucleotidyltransferase